MSVQTEYARALEAMLARIRQSEEGASRDWTRALEDARCERNPDLSTAAAKCMAALDRVDAEMCLTTSTESDDHAAYLRDPFENLLAHCRLVLGSR